MFNLAGVGKDTLAEEFEEMLKEWKNKNSIFFEDLLSSKKVEKMIKYLEGIT